MAWTVQEVVAARETLARLLEEIGLADYLFGIEACDQGWQVRVECRSREGSHVSAFRLEPGMLEQCDQDPLVRRRLRRVLSERLGECVRSTQREQARDSQVSEVMTRDVNVVTPDASVAEVRDLFAQLALHHLPVVEADHVLGIISSNDLLGLGLEPLGPDTRLRARHIMHASPITVRDDASVRDAAATLSGGGFHALPVVDAEQRLVGIVTSTDLVRFLAQQG